MNVRQNLVSSKKYGIKCPNSMVAEYITIHNTANDASAENEIQYMIANSKEISFHFAVDDKEVVQGIDINRNAWHCGDGSGTGNRKSIGVEICYSKSGGDRYRKAEANAIKFVAQLLKERGWGIGHVKKHEDWSKKHCPHRILDEGRWNDVLAAIKAEIAPKPVQAQQSQPAPTTRKVFLPANNPTWTVYKLGHPCVKSNPANIAGVLKPAKFGGLTYTILKENGNGIYEIQTSNFGRVQIYAAPSTGAKIM
ncbi:MAG: phage N-acetylmuramoyl-L-alanine amidase-like protein [Neobacillus sp.]|nr:phage N-acetylmuramoyl-L-alanine amidase-like protein [Neobacillus sp.]